MRACLFPKRKEPIEERLKIQKKKKKRNEARGRKREGEERREKEEGRENKGKLSVQKGMLGVLR